MDGDFYNHKNKINQQKFLHFHFMVLSKYVFFNVFDPTICVLFTIFYFIVKLANLNRMLNILVLFYHHV